MNPFLPWLGTGSRQGEGKGGPEKAEQRAAALARACPLPTPVYWECQAGQRQGLPWWCSCWGFGAAGPGRGGKAAAMKRCPRKCAGIIKSVEQTGPISPRGPVQRNTEKAAASGAQAVGGSVPLRGTVAARAERAPARPNRKGGPNRQNRGPPQRGPCPQAEQRPREPLRACPLRFGLDCASAPAPAPRRSAPGPPIEGGRAGLGERTPGRRNKTAPR